MIISNAIHYIVTLTPVATSTAAVAAVTKLCDFCELNDSNTHLQQIAVNDCCFISLALKNELKSKKEKKCTTHSPKKNERTNGTKRIEVDHINSYLNGQNWKRKIGSHVY